MGGSKMNRAGKMLMMEIEVRMIRIKMMIINMNGHTYDAFKHFINNDIQAGKESQKKMEEKHNEIKSYIDSITNESN